VHLSERGSFLREGALVALAHRRGLVTVATIHGASLMPFAPSKGADVLHRAWQLVAQRRPQARCLMVGPVGDFTPPDTERLEVRAPVGPIEMKEILRRARVVALPSRAEGMPMVLTEAMSLGRPFVSTPVGGIPELASGGGMLVPVDDELALADRLTELLADPELARKIGERGRRFCLETRSIEVIDARLRKLYAAAGCLKWGEPTCRLRAT
jgi:hypothetical protein